MKNRREPQTGDKHSTVMIRVPFQIKLNIEALADKLDISVSTLVRRAIDRHLEREYNA